MNALKERRVQFGFCLLLQNLLIFDLKIASASDFFQVWMLNHVEPTKDTKAMLSRLAA